VKLLFDENLPPRLADVLQSEFSGSIHVHSCGPGSADDEAIWEYAGREGFTIVSKDSDFQERSVLRGSPPKVIWLRIPNSSTSEIAAWIRGALNVIQEFIADLTRHCWFCIAASQTWIPYTANLTTTSNCFCAHGERGGEITRRARLSRFNGFPFPA
jgi:predicted nuclease of predicted toxin-antitoxin system